jgi:type IV pilus assembly protein PilC
LDVIIRRRTNQRFRDILENIREQVKSGSSLSEAFAAHSDTFPAIYTSALLAGETSGDLVNVLHRYIRYAKLVAEVRKKIISAFIYPVILVLFSICLLTILLTFVIPRFQTFYANMEAELPVPTQILITLSAFAKNQFLLILLGLVVLAFLFRIWRKTERGGLLLDSIKIKIPFFGQMFLRQSISEMTRTLATVLGGGIPLVPSLEIAAQAISNQRISAEITRSAQKVREGGSLAASLEDTGLMTDMAIEMVEVGESTGSLEEMLNNISDFYDVEIDNFLGRMMTMLEPVILIFMGILVAGMLLSIYLPLFKALEYAR